MGAGGQGGQGGRGGMRAPRVCVHGGVGGRGDGPGRAWLAWLAFAHTSHSRVVRCTCGTSDPPHMIPPWSPRTPPTPHHTHRTCPYKHTHTHPAVFLAMTLEGSPRSGVLVVVGSYFGAAIGRLPHDPVRTTSAASFPSLLEGMALEAQEALTRGYRCDVGRVEGAGCVDACLRVVLSCVRGGGEGCAGRC